MPVSEEEMKEKYLQFQVIQQQLEQVSEHAQLLNQRNAELDVSINAIKEIGKTEKDREILAPIADGIFFKAILKDNAAFIVNVGSETAVEKTMPQVVKLLEEQKENLNLQIIQAEAILQELNSQALKIYQEFQSSNK